MRIYWQGPSVGFDAGADGDRTMMLVYNLPATRRIFRRFGGVDGSAYFIGGFGLTALTDQIRRRADPLRRRRPARRHVVYLKFTPRRPGIRSDGAERGAARLTPDVPRCCSHPHSV